MWMTDLINNIVKEGCIPDYWRKSILVPVYKGKGDPLVCGSYRAIKILEQPIKVLERVLEKRIRCQVSIDNMQFGFMPGKGTTDAISIMRQVQEKHQAKKKKLYYAFVDLEKAFDRVPREVVRWVLRKLGVDEWLIRTVMALYTEACTVVRTDAGLSESFEVKVDLHQGSVLSPLLFAAVIDVVSSEARSGLPSELLYADDLVIMAPTMEQLGRRVADWRASLLGKGLKVNAGKSKVMVGSSGGKIIVNSGKWPCGVCGKGVQANSVQCTVCKKWIHKRCSDVRGDLSRVADGFRCRRCDGTIQEVYLAEDIMVDGETYECVKSFCCLGDIDGDGGADLATIRCNRIEHWVHLRCAGIRQAQYTDTWTCHLHRESRLTPHTDITPPHRSRPPSKPPTPPQPKHRHMSNTPPVPRGFVKPKPNSLIHSPPSPTTPPRAKHIHMSHTPPTPLTSTSPVLDKTPEPRVPLIHALTATTPHPDPTPALPSPSLTLSQHTHMQHKQQYMHHSHRNNRTHNIGYY